MSMEPEMELIMIVVTVCAVAHPDQCEEQRLEFSSQFSLRRCVMSAQPYLAQWIGEHPKWTIKDYHCEYPHSKEKADARRAVRKT
jgi:hypothetical protein